MQPLRAAILAVLPLSPIAAQAPAMMDVHRVLPPFRQLGKAQAVGDVNGDTYQDLVIAGFGATSDVWLASASGTFTRVDGAFPLLADVCTALVLADVDGDGDLDCITAHAQLGSSGSGLDRIFVNDGTGRFSESAHSPLPSSQEASHCIAAADIDGDGDQDVVVGSPVTYLGTPPFGIPFGGGLCVYVNGGTGQFTLENNRLASVWTEPGALAFFDRDGDGDTDLFAGPRTSSPTELDRVFVNDGLGFFTAAPVGGSTTNEITHHVAARDFDQDGDVDLLLAKTVYPAMPVLRHLVNNGTGGFMIVSPAPPSFAAVPTQLLTGDWNGDLRIDYALRHLGQIHTFVGTAAGQFQASQLPAASLGERTVHAIDFEGDGDTDLLAPPAFLNGPFGSLLAAAEAELLRNLGNAWASIPPRELPPMTINTGTRQSLTDVDGDGHLDVTWAPTFWNPGRIFRGDGTGAFAQVPAGSFGADQFFSGSPAFGDVDGDGDVDIVCPSHNEIGYPVTPSKLHLRTNGTWVSAPFPPLTSDLAAIGDVDGDNDLDLLFADQLQASILTNDGSGAFTTSVGALPPGMTGNRGGSFADLDGDGDLDLAASSSGWLQNDGTGHFTASVIAGFPPIGAVTTLDFDGDQDTDLFVAVPGAQCQLFLNNGLGSFSPQAMPIAGNSRVAAIDVDADGRCDFVEYEHSFTAPATRLWWNTPAGLLASPGSVVHASHYIRSMVPGDIDEDGDLDLLVASDASPLIYRNLQHQLAWRTLPRIGFPLDLDLYGRANEPWILALAFTATELPLGSFGTLRLDPGSLLVAAFGQYDAGGAASFSLFAPALPALIGLPVYWQTLSGTQARLGNLETTVLRGN